MTHVFHPSILRAYDIRGIVGETLSTADAHAIGLCFADRVRAAGGRTVAVARDGRASSPDMEAALVDGLSAGGVDVVRLGCGPTPMLYFATATTAADSGIMVTGSHNPPAHNGFKMVLRGKPFFGADITAFASAEQTPAAQAGAVSDDPGVIDRYLDVLAEAAACPADVSAVWDPGNGAAGEVVSRLVQRLPGRHVVINGEIDGTFPNHHPDPTVAENLAQIIDRVRTEGADVGLAFDGDGDRIGVVDGQGRILWGDQLLALLARPVLAARPGATVIADVKASQVLFDAIADMGGVPEMWQTGHSLIKQRMAETAAPLAGEMSGHVFFADSYYGFDDGIYAAVRVLNLLEGLPEGTLAAAFDALPKPVNTPELRIPCADDRKFAVIEEVRARLEAADATFSAVDGVRVMDGAGGWWLLRASNTQAVLVARAEALNADGLDAQRRALAEQLQASDVIVNNILFT